MQSVILGKTGLNVSRLSFGGIPIQRADAANTRAVVDQLEQHGVNFLDTARGYTVSEDYLGAALEGRRDHFILATKSMSRDYAGMQKDIDASLADLRTGHIELYQLHNLSERDFDRAFGPEGARPGGSQGRRQDRAYRRDHPQRRRPAPPGGGIRRPS